MKSFFVVCKHPESSQTSYDIVHALSADETVSVAVYGVQNVTPNKARNFAGRPNVEVVSADDSKLDLDSVQAELAKRSPSDVLVVHTLNIVAALCTSLQPALQGLRSHLYCEVPRELPMRNHCDALKAFVSADKIDARVYCSTPEVAAFLKPFAPGVAVMPPGLSHRHYHRMEPCAPAREALGIKDGDFAVLSIGRIHTGVLAFAQFLRDHPSVEAKLIMPIDQSLKDTVIEMYVNELALRGLDPAAHMSCLVLLRDVGFMSSEEANIVYNAASVVLHANPITDYNSSALQCALVGVPQILPSGAASSALDPSLVTVVDPSVQIYVFDDLGGRLQLVGHGAMAAALTGAYAHLPELKDRAATLAGVVCKQAKTTLSWGNWRSALLPTPKADYDAEIADLKAKLAEIMIAFKQSRA